MGDDFAIVEIIILAMVALFIGLRLRSVLGKHRADEPPGTPGERSHPGTKEAGAEPGEALGFGGSTFPNANRGGKISGSDNPLIRKIFGALGQAGFAKFMAGAQTAYEMTLKGFWAGEMAEMEPYIDEDVLRGFQGAIAARKKSGQVVDNRLVEVLEAKLDDVEINNDSAEITVRFESEIVAVLRDRYGKLLEGNVTDTIKVIDIWTFARHLKSKDPNWVLVATQAG